MTSDRKKLGALGEKIAVEFLKERSYRILETNFRCSLGEIDVIAQKEDCLIFVEVRTRRSKEYGTPEESITPSKVERLIALAQTYLQTHENLPPEWRIDVVVVELDPRRRLKRVELIENAVS